MSTINSSVRNISAPNLPVSPVTFEQRFMDQYSNVLRLFHTRVVNSVNAPMPYGSFYDTTTQTNPVANAVNLMRWNSVYDGNDGTVFGVKKDTNRIYVTETGVYNIQFSAQVDKTGGGNDHVHIWIRINGQNVPHSASKVIISGPNDEKVAAWNWMLTLQANDYFEIAWSSASTDMVLLAEPATGDIPEIPSVIVTVMWVSNVAV